jgi:hypothetical protein
MVMDGISHRWQALVTLGRKMSDLAMDKDLLETAKIHNAWFTPDFSKRAFKGWSQALRSEAVEQWYDQALSNGYSEAKTAKQVGILCAGNLPMVGLHDMLTAYVLGHQVKIKLSSDDKILMLAVIDSLKGIDPTAVIDPSDNLKGIEAIIATGNNNSLGYFKQYFGHLPHLFRSSRTSVAVLDGNETAEDMANLAEDVFLFFGRGCRSVTHLFIPEDYDVQRLFKSWFDWGHLAEHAKYGSNFDYHRALYMLNKEFFLENHFTLLRENPALKPPVAVIHASRYANLNAVKSLINEKADEIQTTVGKGMDCAFGQSQLPELWDYSDGVDTLSFLAKA